MENKNKIKGDALEDAVEMIHRIILTTNPNFKNAKLTFERKKIIYPDNVKMEIDLFVKVDPGNDMESIFIFECKNWDHKSVPPKEIRDFSAKITATNATKGFMVAKKLSKYAINLLKKHSRIILLKVEDNPPIDLTPFPDMHMILIQDKKVFGEIVQRDIEKYKNTKKEKITENNICKLYNNKNYKLNDLFIKFADRMINNFMKKQRTDKFDEGLYSSDLETEFIFNKDDLLIDNIDVEKIKLKVNFEVIVVKPKIVSFFDIHKKGRYLKLESVAPNQNVKVTTEMVAVK